LNLKSVKNYVGADKRHNRIVPKSLRGVRFAKAPIPFCVRFYAGRYDKWLQTGFP
jgi:hypothetical protein